ncbi:MAG: AAA family ATPase [Anaerolineae bacterium]
MVGLLLTTKLYAPRPRHNVVPRPRLVAQLEESVRIGRALTLIAAPAGFGKTTLLGEWLAAGEYQPVWLSLDEGDNDIASFLPYLINGLQALDDQIGATAQQLLGSPQLQASALPSILTSLINDLAHYDDPVIMVLDDYHLIEESGVHQAVTFLLDHLPPRVHVVISTRELPPLPLPRLRARDQITEINERQLRLTSEETAAFLNGTMALELPAESIAALESHTEGWIAGLQLAALALRQRDHSAASLLASLPAAKRYIADYLVSEVVERESAAVQHFLTQTSILDHFTASLCAAITGMAEVECQRMLDYLDDSNLFIVPLDDQHGWYRYHRLFAETLRARLSAQHAAPLHLQAVGWYETRGFNQEAVQQALRFGVVSGDFAAALRLIRSRADALFHAGNIHTLRGWLALLPDADVRADADLAVLKGWLLVLSGDMSSARGYAEALAGQTDSGKVLLFQAYLALGRQEYTTTTTLARQSLELFAATRDKDHDGWRVLALWAVAEAEERSGTITAAIEALREARRLSREAGNSMFGAMLENSLMSALDLNGRSQEAISIGEETIRRYTTDRGTANPLLTLIYHRLALLHLQANRIEEAQRCYDLAAKLMQSLEIDSVTALSHGVAAQLHFAAGDADAALVRIGQVALAEGSGEQVADTTWLAALQATIWLRQGKLTLVKEWVEAQRLTVEDTPTYLRFDAQLVLARLLLAQPDHELARQWLAKLHTFASDHQWTRHVITLELLRTLAAAQAEQWEAA